MHREADEWSEPPKKLETAWSWDVVWELERESGSGDGKERKDVRVGIVGSREGETEDRLL